jgi:hypothetical protein
MSWLTPRLCALFTAVAVLPSSTAFAHCITGGRFFPATLVTDDPCVADEMSFPTLQYNSANPSGRENDIEADFSKRITESFGISVASTWTRVSPPANAGTLGPVGYGFQNFQVTAQFQLLKDPQREVAMLAGVIFDFANTGAADVGATSWSTVQPTFYIGKGFGDLPDSAGVLRAFGVTGEIGYQIPTTSFDVVAGSPVPQNLVWSGSLQYSMPYLKSNIVDLRLPDFINHLIPIVEAQFSAPVQNNFGNPNITIGTVNPGVIWVGSYFQVGVEAVIPINRASGTVVGAMGQLHFYLDDIFPNTLGQPLLGGITQSTSMAGR